MKGRTVEVKRENVTGNMNNKSTAEKKITNQRDCVKTKQKENRVSSPPEEYVLPFKARRKMNFSICMYFLNPVKNLKQ